MIHSEESRDQLRTHLLHLLDQLRIHLQRTKDTIYRTLKLPEQESRLEMSLITTLWQEECILQFNKAKIRTLKLMPLWWDQRRDKELRMNECMIHI